MSFSLLLGIALVCFGLYRLPQREQRTAAERIRVTLSHDIGDRGRRSHIDKIISTREFQNGFHILKGSIPMRSQDIVSELKSGQALELLVPADGVTVHGICLNGNWLMSEREFYRGRRLYYLRHAIIGMFVGAMLLLTALVKVPERVSYGVVIAFVMLLFGMWYFEVGLYH